MFLHFTFYVVLFYEMFYLWNMKAVITADIINSTKSTTNSWMVELKKTLNFFGKEGKDWEIYRGDEFQIVLNNPAISFYTALIIKASLKIKNFDAKIAIGLGEIYC